MNYSKRRENVFKKLKKNEMALFFSGEALRNSADSEYEFNANRNYFYLTGLSEPSGILMLIKREEFNQEMLFIRDIDPNKEKWIGRFIQPQKAKEVSGINSINFVSSFKQTFEMLLSRSVIKSLYLDFDRQVMDSRALEADVFYESIKRNYPALKIKNSNPIVSKLRTYKDEDEVTAIKEAIELTNQAIEHAIKNMKPGQKEYEVMAEFLYILNKNNATEMFDTIMASGENGPILHYVENNGELKDGDLILFDLGAKLNHYGADISRTYPVNGKFTERQKQLYDIVLEAHYKINEAAKPGVTLRELNNIVIEHYKVKLKEIGLIQDESEVSQYYYHSVSHFLGLDTHDVGQITDEPLEENQVITNEPGLYIQEENIGIRIETDLLITKDGNENLAPQIKITTQDIEELMKN